MEKKVLSEFRTYLRQHHKNLMSWLRGNDRIKKLNLGIGERNGESVTKDDVPVLAKIEDTLEQIDNGSFGKCTMCDGEVETQRLLLDFTTCVCLDHYSEFQLRELEQDLELAAQVQRNLLPSDLPSMDGVQIAVASRPAGVVGGDYYDFFSFRDHHYGLAVADVMGKGVPASMLMANLQASLRILGPTYQELSELADRMNQLFRYNLKQIRFITLFLAALDADKKILHYSNAGHHPPFLWKAATGTAHWLKPTGPAIGLGSDVTFKSEQLKLDQGDVVLLYTDGLVEARNGKDEFGQQRVADYVERHHTEKAEDLMNGLVDQLHEYAGSPQDDMTIMVLKVD